MLKRRLNLKIQNSLLFVDIRVFPPRESDGCWMCRYEIEWPEGRQTMEAGGSDSVQSLIGALQMIGADLYTSSYHRNGELQSLGDGWTGYGFPVPYNLRDALIGEDARFF
ncbi:MAG: hypothetical protein B7X99_01560 [Rhizobiales bacterium 17-65-6]|nr:MAG: hypothetical protein B7X99_01560 [Rhizobiales bacterium 17-65-6]